MASSKLPKAQHGGRRPGAGRPKLEPIVLPPVLGRTPAEFLLSVMNNEAVDARLRIEAAKILMPYFHQRVDVSKKAAAQVKAMTAHEGTEWEGLLPELSEPN